MLILFAMVMWKASFQLVWDVRSLPPYWRLCEELSEQSYDHFLQQRQFWCS